MKNEVKGFSLSIADDNFSLQERVWNQHTHLYFLPLISSGLKMSV